MMASEMCAESSTSAGELRSCPVVWLHKSVDEQHDAHRSTITCLRARIAKVHLCSTLDQCIQILSQGNGEKVFMVLSGELVQNMLPSIHDMVCIDSIYMVCDGPIQHEQWTKVRGVFTSANLIHNLLQQITTAQYGCDAIPTSLLPRRKIENLVSNGDSLKQIPPTFIYSILAKEIISEIPDDASIKSMEDFITHCRAKKITEVELAEFQHIYQTKSVVYLYTCRLFLNNMLNDALRLLETRTLVKAEFLIRKLYRELEQLHVQQKDQLQNKTISYYGQEFSQKRLQQLLNTKGGHLSFNSYLLASMQQDVTISFLELVLKRKKNLAVLFIITIDVGRISCSKTPFAVVDKENSCLQVQEILFSMHTIFSVESIKQSSTNRRLWEVQLTLTDSDDPRLANLIGAIREQTDGIHWFRMAKFMYRLGEFSQAEELCEKSLEDCTNNHDRATILQQLGYLKDKQGVYQEALKHYEESLHIQRITLCEDHASLAPIYNQIGNVQYKMNNCLKALEYYIKSHKILENILPKSHPDLAISYSNIGLMYNNINDHSKALKNHESALKIRKKKLPSNHPDLCASYNSIASVYLNMGDYTKALEYYQMVHRILKKAIPKNHLDLAASYNNMGLVYDNMEDYTKALEYYEISLKIRIKALPEDHSHIALSYNNIAAVYYSTDNYSKALEYYEMSHQILVKSLPMNDPDLASLYSNIGLVYDSLNDYAKALEYYQRALKIQESTVYPNHPDFATSYNNIGLVYDNMGDYSKALEYYEKSHKILETAVPKSHPNLGYCCTNIGFLYDSMKNYSHSLRYFEQAYDILEKSFAPGHANTEIVEKCIECLKVVVQ